VRDAFHQAAVTEEHPGAVVHDLVTRAVEGGGEELLRERHADRVGQPLAERAGGGLDAKVRIDLRMPAVCEPNWRKFLSCSISSG